MLDPLFEEQSKDHGRQEGDGERDPFATVQDCPDGLVFTVTAYADPVATLVANVNGPLAATDRSSPPLSCSTTVPDSPETDPPTENDAVAA